MSEKIVTAAIVSLAAAIGASIGARLQGASMPGHAVSELECAAAIGDAWGGPPNRSGFPGERVSAGHIAWVYDGDRWVPVWPVDPPWHIEWGPQP